MHEEETNAFSRRSFLAISGKAAALTGAATLLPHMALADEALPLTDRKAPAKPIVLRSPAGVEVVLDAEDGLPYQYTVAGSRMRGEDFGRPFTVRICRKDPRNVFDLPLKVSRSSHSGGSADFRFSPAQNGAPAVSFAIRYALKDATLKITLEDVHEFPGYELISIDMPRLVTIREEDGVGWLAHGDAGGSLAMLHEATAGSLPLNRFWGNVSGTLPVVMVGVAKAMCVQETTAYMDGTLLSVVGTPGSRRASIGTAKTWRVDGSGCYDMNLAKGAPLNCGNANTPNLLVEQPSSCRLDFLPVQGAAEQAWLTAAKLVRGRMPPILTHRYDDKYTYGILCDQPLFAEPRATFTECETKIQQAAEIIDGCPQIVHLWGWQFRGKDTGYPAVAVVDARLGGYDGMMRLMEKSKVLNATVTLSDNYDDAYRSSPVWDTKIIARGPNGQLWKSRSWTGEDSYILGLAKYMAGPGMERVRYTCERYRLPWTTHIDVLSYYSIRNDWDPEHPASGIRNLFKGRYLVVDAFKAKGVDVSSEALRYPMIGHISAFWYMSGPGKCPFGGKRIPLLPLVYRKSAVWGLSGDHKPDIDEVRLDELFLGATPRSVGISAAKAEDLPNLFYLWMVPWFQWHLRNIESFHREGDSTVLGLEGNSSIEIDWTQKTYRIVLDGDEAARSGQVSCPLASDRIAFYTTEARTLSARLPAAWSRPDLGAVTIVPGNRKAFPFQIKGDRVEIAAPANKPVIVYRDKGKMRLSKAD